LLDLGTTLPTPEPLQKSIHNTGTDSWPSLRMARSGAWCLEHSGVVDIVVKCLDEQLSELPCCFSPAAHQVTEVSEQVGDPGGNREGEDPAEGVCFC
jgi:hypothetical protein